MTVTGAGSLVTLAGAGANERSLVVGEDLTGTANPVGRYSFFLIDQNARVVVGNGQVRVGTVTNGQLTIANGGELTTVGGLEVGTTAGTTQSKVDVADGTLNVAGSLDFSRGNSTLGNGAAVTAGRFQVGGTADQASVTVNGVGGSAVVQVANMTHVQNKGTLTVKVGGYITSAGKLKVWEGGRLDVNGGTFDAKMGGENYGTINLNGGELKGKVENKGTGKMSALDGVGTGTGAIVGNFEQDVDGRLEIDLDGTGHDLLYVSDDIDTTEVEGDVTLGGTLAVTSTITPLVWSASAPDNYYILVSATGELTGEFDATELPDPNSLGLPTLPSGLAYAWNVIYDTDDIPDPELPWTVNGTEDVVLLLEVVSVDPHTSGVAGRVWDDADHDGVQDSNEVGMANVLVHLLDSNGNIVASATTDSEGNFVFDGLAAGSYSMQFEAPAERVFTTPNQGDDAFDSDAWSSGFTSAFDLLVDQIRTDIDAGMFEVALG